MPTSPDERWKEQERIALEEAVFRMLEAGYTIEEVREEVEYALQGATK